VTRLLQEFFIFITSNKIELELQLGSKEYCGNVLSQFVISFAIVTQILLMYALPVIKEVLKVKWLQSGGFADVFIVDGLVYKYFHTPHSELTEFKNVEYIMDKQSQGFDLSHVVTYIGYGYTPKLEVFDIFMRSMNGKSSQDRSIVMKKLINNYASYNSVPFICMEYIPGMDGWVSIILDGQCYSMSLNHVTCISQ